MERSEQEELVTTARKATVNAVARYSGIHVGVALRVKDGPIVTGVNVESASYGLTCCAERVALFSALSQGHREFTALALVSSVTPHLVPCGACRQLLAEHAPDVVVWCAGMKDGEGVDEFRMEELLPAPLSQLPDDAGKIQ